MSIILSISGLFKMLLILIGMFVVLRFIGQLMIARRNMSEQNDLRLRDNQLRKEQEYINQNKGKIFISKKGNSKGEDIEYKDVS